jgi:hypothetical protein
MRSLVRFLNKTFFLLKKNTSLLQV